MNTLPMFHLLNGESVEGPFTIRQLNDMRKLGKVTGDSLVKQPDDEDWLPLKIFEDMATQPRYAPGAGSGSVGGIGRGASDPVARASLSLGNASAILLCLAIIFFLGGWWMHSVGLGIVLSGSTLGAAAVLFIVSKCLKSS